MSQNNALRSKEQSSDTPRRDVEFPSRPTTMPHPGCCRSLNTQRKFSTTATGVPNLRFKVPSTVTLGFHYNYCKKFSYFPVGFGLNCCLVLLPGLKWACPSPPFAARNGMNTNFYNIISVLGIKFLIWGLLVCTLECHKGPRIIWRALDLSCSVWYSM